MSSPRPAQTAPARLPALRRRPGMVHLYGHRGARGVMPENTMEGFRHAFDIGLKAIEVDVLTTRDGIAVLTHNPALLAETTRGADGAWLAGTGPAIQDLSLLELSAFDVGAIRGGSDYHAKFPDQARLQGARVPTLDALCALVAERPGVWLNVEVKSYANAPRLTAPPEALVAATLEPLRRHGLAPRSLVQSFDWRVLAAFEQAAPEIPRAYLSYLDRAAPTMQPNIYTGSPWMNGRDLDAEAGAGPALPRLIADLGGAGWAPYFEDLTPAALEAAHAAGLCVNVWTVNAAEDIARMAEMGVDGIITDFPARAQNVLDGLGLDWREPGAEEASGA